MENALYTVIFHTPLRLVIGMTPAPSAEAARELLAERGSDHPLWRLYLSFEGLPPVLSFLVIDTVNKKLIGSRAAWLSWLWPVSSEDGGAS